MSICPFAELKLLPENYTQARIVPRCVINHSAGGEAELYGWWQNEQSRGLECHFWVGRNGRIVEYMDTEVRADANGEANGYAVSIETQSTVNAAERWDPLQAAALVKLNDWLCSRHNIPRRLMKTPTDSGLAWHVQFGAPGPWTRAAGKVCPGPARIEQFKTEIVPAVARSSAGAPPTPAPKPAPASFRVTAPSGSPALKRGSTGRLVAELQVALNYGTGTRLLGDASFGPSTEQAVKNLQTVCKLTADGIYGERSHLVLQVACNGKAG